MSSDSAVGTSYVQQQGNDLEALQDVLRSELDRNFRLGEVSPELYSSEFSVTDPIFSSTGLSAFQQNLRLLRSVFDINLYLHSVSSSPDTDEIITRWTFTARGKALPVAQNLTFTGKSYYSVDRFASRLTSQRDVWDAISNNSFLSAEGLAHVMRMALDPKTTPNLDTPRYEVLQKRADYEVRRYASYLVAEVSMPPGSSPAAGTGFNELAGYIFGGNDRSQPMEMTTPVLSTAGQSGPAANKMAFVMESQYDMDNLPVPRDSRVERKQIEAGKIFAAWTFSGLPLDFEVVEAERRCRGALLVDGLKPKPGYMLARYNDPFTLPFLRRNEVLIELEDFKLE